MSTPHRLQVRETDPDTGADAVRSAMSVLALAAHVEACGLTHAGDDWRQCGDGGYCETAEAIPTDGHGYVVDPQHCTT